MHSIVLQNMPNLNPMEMLQSILDKKLASKLIYLRAALIDSLEEVSIKIDA